MCGHTASFIKKRIWKSLAVWKNVLTLQLLSWKQSFYLKELIPIEDLERLPAKVIAFFISYNFKYRHTPLFFIQASGCVHVASSSVFSARKRRSMLGCVINIKHKLGELHKKNRMSHDNRFSKTNYLKTNLLKQIKKISFVGKFRYFLMLFCCKDSFFYLILKRLSRKIILIVQN